MNFKSTKLSALPEDAINLLFYLGHDFNEFKIFKQNNDML